MTTNTAFGNLLSTKFLQECILADNDDDFQKRLEVLESVRGIPINKKSNVRFTQLKTTPIKYAISLCTDDMEEASKRIKERIARVVIALYEHCGCTVKENLKFDDYITALHYAIIKDNVPVVIALLTQIDDQTQVGMYWPFGIAEVHMRGVIYKLIENNQYEMLRVFAQFKARLFPYDINFILSGQNALLLAVRLLRVECVRVLIMGFGADPHELDIFESWPIDLLHDAVRQAGNTARTRAKADDILYLLEHNERGLALAMGEHLRLGRESALWRLDPELLHMIHDLGLHTDNWNYLEME